MKTVALVSRKGGAGKTTLAVNLAISAHLAGFKTMLADIDPQRSATDALKARVAPGPILMEINAGKLFQTKVHAEHAGLDLLIVDTPAAPEADVLQAVQCADLCVLVCRPTFLDIASVARSTEAVRRLGKPGLIVLNQAPAKRLGEEPTTVLQAVQALRFCGLPIAPIGLRARAAYQHAIARGLSACEWAPGDPASQEIERLWRHVEALALSTQDVSQARTN
ncbi:MAG: AAA family ATPase [Alphaproteobacteria bacterium]|nr:AAA family ATPase [Alphaproteobacteria bacterium]